MDTGEIDRRGNPIIKCEMCRKKQSSFRLRDWDWFTGVLSRTHHYCPSHKRTTQRDEAFARSRLAPAKDPK